MSTITFDTHKAVKRLIGKGINQAHAEAIVEAMQESREVDFSQLVTKDYLKSEMGQLEVRLIKWQIGISIATISIMSSVMIAILKFYFNKGI